MTEDIKKACEVMAAGGIILYPTDTIWGIGCDATNEKAVQRVYELKRRADNKAMLVLMDSEAKLDRYVSDVPDIAWDLISVSDKPLTIIYSGIGGDQGGCGLYRELSSGRYEQGRSVRHYQARSRWACAGN